MKIKIKEFTHINTLLSHALLTSAIDKTKSVSSVVTAKQEWKDATDSSGTKNIEVNVQLTVEGVEIDVRKFFQRLENDFDTSTKRAARPIATELFETWKQKYKSTNSPAAKLEKIKSQVDRCVNELKNIDENLTSFNSM